MPSKRLAAPARQSDWLNTWGLPFFKLATAISPEVEGRFDDFLVHYAKQLVAEPPMPCPGVVKSLKDLSRLGPLFVPLVHGLLIRTDLQSLGLLSCFEFVCGSDWQPQPKPHKASLTPILEMLAHKGVANASCVYVGDTITDAEPANAAGLHFVGAGYTDEAARLLRTSSLVGDRVINNLAELPRFIRSMPTAPA